MRRRLRFNWRFDGVGAKGKATREKETAGKPTMVDELIAKREPDWKELERLTTELSDANAFSAASRDGAKIARFAALYRATCGDLALAESRRFPPGTIRYLNDLVGVAHNLLYRRQVWDWKTFGRVIFFDAPRWLLTDAAFWAALALFWIPFWTCGAIAQRNPEFARYVVGDAQLEAMEDMYSESFDQIDMFERVSMAAFYIQHNGGIGLRCFALGALFAFPGIYILAFNATSLGVSFGYMSSGAVSADVAARFAEFTTAHGPFELTAVVLSAAAGMRIGFGLIKTNGYSRLDSARRAAIKAAPAMGAAFALFCGAAILEAFVSPRPTLLGGVFGDAATVKQAIALLSTALLVFYLLGLGGVSWAVKRGWLGAKEKKAATKID
ncbi:MAG: stage II sporulation protein M [Thermoguttaceae bacterium]|nr:stage II sporulation protein M [Thermoguttaceae bacterium]